MAVYILFYPGLLYFYTFCMHQRDFHENEEIKREKEGEATIVYIPTIFKLNAPKLTKFTSSRKFSWRGTLPPLLDRCSFRSVLCVFAWLVVVFACHIKIEKRNLCSKKCWSEGMKPGPLILSISLNIMISYQTGFSFFVFLFKLHHPLLTFT